jgi:hypothetical protein
MYFRKRRIKLRRFSGRCTSFPANDLLELAE